MSQASFPGPGPDGEQPPPGDPARDDDWDGDAEMASYIADLDAGRARIPEEWEVEGPAATIGLGDAADVDLAELAAMLGPDGLGGEVFARDRSADAMRPGPVLAALTEQAAGDLGRLTDNQVLGAMSAAGRLAARAEYLRLAAVAEFTRRREAQLEDAKARGVPRGCRDGEFPDAELGMELVTSPGAARDMMDMALDLPARLPRTWAALGAGLIDGYRARLIWKPTQHLTDADAAHADEILAALAPGLRYDQLARKATAVAMKLDPEAFKRGKDAGPRRPAAGAGGPGRLRQRVPVRPGTGHRGRARVQGAHRRARGRAAPRRAARHPAAPAGTGLQRPDPGPRPARPPHRTPARRASRPGRLRQPGGWPGLPRRRTPDTRHAPRRCRHGRRRPPGGRDSTDAGDGDDDASWDGCPDMTQWQHERRGTREDDDHHDDGPGAPPGPPAPFPALINLTVPAGTAYGWSTAPGEAGGWGLTDPDDTRRLLQAASLHPRTRWRVTLLAPDGTAAAHGCARGPHPWIPPPDSGQRNRDGPDARQAAALAEFLRDLNITFTPIAKGSCDHASREDRYTPSRKLKDLIRARTARCTAPGCGAQAVHCDLDHTLPYPAGITCQCDLAPACRRHHRCKQAPGWQLTQPEPGIMIWTTPSGRSYTTRPTVYEM